MHSFMNHGRGRMTVGGSIAALSIAAAAVTAAIVVSQQRPATEGIPRLAGDPTAGSSHYWNSVGSAGTIDEDDLDIAKLGGPTITILNSASVPATLNVRYDVTVSETFIGTNVEDILGGFYVDNGPDAQVTLKLKSLNMTTGAITTLMEFDSDDFPQSSTGQVQYVLPGSGVTYNFNTTVYWVEAAIIRTSSAGRASLSGVFAGQY